MFYLHHCQLKYLRIASFLSTHLESISKKPNMATREVADKRLPNTFVACPIVYGSIAFYLGKKAQEYQTHSWTLYVRGPQDEDLSTFVSKIAFTLHPSFAQPVREVTKPPFQITETGWGEFEAGIRIFFKDPSEQPVDLFHHLRLYPPNPAHQLNPKKPVVSENYDEIVFASPFTKFHSMLMQYGVSSKSTSAAIAASLGGNINNSSNIAATSNMVTTAWPEHYLAFDDAMDMEMLLSIQQQLQRDLFEAKKKVVDLETQVIEVAQGYAGPAPASSTATKSSTSTKNKQTNQPKSATSKKEKNGENSVKLETDGSNNIGNDMQTTQSASLDILDPLNLPLTSGDFVMDIDDGLLFHNLDDKKDSMSGDVSSTLLT